MKWKCIQCNKINEMHNNKKSILYDKKYLTCKFCKSRIRVSFKQSDGGRSGIIEVKNARAVLRDKEKVNVFIIDFSCDIRRNKFKMSNIRDLQSNYVCTKHPHEEQALCIKGNAKCNLCVIDSGSRTARRFKLLNNHRLGIVEQD